MTPRIVDMPFADYLAHPSYGSSDVRAFKRGTAAMVKWQRENRHGDTDATRIGRAAHCLILTPDLFMATHAIKAPGMEFRSKEAKSQRDAWLAEGRTILDAEEHEQVRQVRDAFFAKAAAKREFRRSVGIEQTVLWECAQSGLPCKGRPDWFTEDVVYDLKVSIEAEKDIGTLSYKAHANGWANQLAHNAAGLRANGLNIRVGRLVVVAPNPPQGPRVWLLEVRENDLDFLEMDNENTRRGMAQCHRSGHWPGTPDEWQQIELPASAAFTEADLEGAEELPI